MFALAICGSPREGNTETVLKLALEDLGQFDVESDIVLLRKMNINYCDSCYQCQLKRDRQCVKKDDISQIIHPKMLKADVILFGSPSYYGSVSAQMKTLMDRCFPFLNMYAPGRLRGKYAINLVCYGRGGGVHVAHTTLDHWCMCMGMHVFDNLSFKVLNKNDAKDNYNIGNRLRLATVELLETLDATPKNKLHETSFPKIIGNEEALHKPWKTSPRSKVLR
jgi:multimeric flavodoxin WrbA